VNTTTDINLIYMHQSSRTKLKFFYFLF